MKKKTDRKNNYENLYSGVVAKSVIQTAGLQEAEAKEFSVQGTRKSSETLS